MTDTQTIRVMELWREVIDMAIKDEDYDALAAMPTDLFMLLGMDDPYASQDELEGHVLAAGCSQAEAYLYD